MTTGDVGPVPAWWDVNPLDTSIAVIATEPPLIYGELLAAAYPLELTCMPCTCSSPPSSPSSSALPAGSDSPPTSTDPTGQDDTAQM